MLKKLKLFLTNKAYQGIVRIREIPFETEEEFKHWWLPERDSAGYVIHPPRMGMKEREKFTVVEGHNTLTLSGRTYLLTYMSVPSGAQPFAAYFAIGSGYTPSVMSNDTTLNTEYARKVPTGYIVNGNQTDASIYFGASEGNGSITNAGFYGSSAATATLGSGVLMTHTQFAYTKVNGIPVTADYLIIQQGA